MAFTESMFWNTDGTGDGPAGGYSRNHWGTLLRTLFGTGVLRGIGDELAVSGAASPLSVGTGAAVVDGIFGANPSPEDVEVPTPSVGTTGHRIVLRATWGATQTLRVALLSNADGVPLSTQVPELQQDSGVLYEVALARFDITTAGVIQGLVNEQGFCHFATALALTADDIPDGAITAAKISGGAVGTSMLAAGAVTSAKIADGAITAAKISGGAVGTSMLADGAVTSAKIADGTIVNADISTSAAIAQSKIDNTSRAIDADKVDGYHAGTSGSQVLVLDSGGKVPLANIPTPLTGKDADTLDGQHGAYYAQAAKLADMAQSKSIQVATVWTLPTSWGDINSLSLSITLNGTCDLHIYATLNRTSDSTGRTAYFRARVDSTDLEVITEGGVGPHVTSGHWYFGGVGSGAHTIKLQGYGSDSSWQVSTRRLSVIVVPK